MINEEAIMTLIVNSGNARSCAMMAIQSAKEGNFDEAEAQIKEAESSIAEAHNAQTSLLQSEAAGEKNEVTLLVVHSQDHLMNAITVIDLAKEFINVYKKMEENC